jgi:hypothetical protein
VRAFSPSIPTLDSFAELQEHVDRAWTNNLSAALVPPGAAFEAHLGLVAFTTNLAAVVDALFPTPPAPSDGIVLYPLRVEENEIPSLLRTWFTPAGAATNTVPPVEYDPEAWVLAQHPIPESVSIHRRAAWIADWKLPGRQQLHLRLIAATNLPAYLAAASNRAANAGTSLAEADLGVIRIQMLPGGQQAEILLHTPPEVDRVALYQADTLRGESTAWAYLGDLPRQSQPLVVVQPLLGERQNWLFANHQRDSDGDGLPDALEELIFRTRPGWVDSDGDGLSDYEEALRHGTDPNAWDSDGDGLDDRLEIASGYDPLLAHTDLTLLDYARLQGIPPLELTLQSTFVGHYSLQTVATHILQPTHPNQGAVEVPASAQEPAHASGETYRASQVLGGRTEVRVNLRQHAVEETSLAPSGSGSCPSFRFGLRYGRVVERAAPTEVNAEAYFGEPHYQAGNQWEQTDGHVCYTAESPTSGDAVVQVALEPALYELTQITPTNIFAAAGGPPVTFTATVQKPFPYYEDYTGPIRWDIVPAVADGPRFVANTNTIFGVEGGILAVEVTPGTTPGVYTLEARIPGIPPTGVILFVVEAEFAVEVTAFIPHDHVQVPLGDIMGGDNRKFDKNANSYRMRQKVRVFSLVEWNPDGMIAGSGTNLVGISRSY